MRHTCVSRATFPVHRRAQRTYPQNVGVGYVFSTKLHVRDKIFRKYLAQFADSENEENTASSSSSSFPFMFQVDIRNLNYSELQ